MKRIAPLGFAVSALALATACSGGYNVIAPSGSSGSGNTAGVVFLVTAPAPSVQNATRKPNISAPAGTQSVSVSLQSVNGIPATGGTPTTQNIASNASGCTVAGNQLVCQFTVSGTPGNDVFLVKMFPQQNAQGTPISAGNVTVSATGGQNTTAPTVLNGTVASIAITPPVLPVGVSGSGNLVVVAKDAQGNTILGNYANPITLSLTDASNQTSLSATTVGDSTAASALTLAYKGGQMPQAATIGATASGVAASAITSGKFLPDSTYPTIDGSTSTYNVSYASGYTQFAPGSLQSPLPVPTLNPVDNLVETVSVATGKSFGGLSNLVAVTPTFSPYSPNNPQSFATFLSDTSGTTYYQWANVNGVESLQRVGESGSLQFFNIADIQQTCAAPYQTIWTAPLAASWDSLAGTGACSSSVDANDGQGDAITGKSVANADGSYQFNFALASGPMSTAMTFTVNANGTGTAIANNMTGGGCCGPSGSGIVTVGTPAPNAASIPVTVQYFPGSIPNPMPSATPTIEPTSIPNWYAAAGVPNGTVTAPLEKDTFTLKSSDTTYDASCAVDSSVVPAGTKIAEVDEAFSDLDPLSGYVQSTTKWYLANGIGVVCEVQNASAYYANSVMNLAPTMFGGGSPGDSREIYATTYSLTPQALQQAMTRTRSFSQAASAAQTQMLAYAGHSRLDQVERLMLRLKAHH